MSKTNYHVTPEEFILAWETSETVDEVVEKLGRAAKEKGSPAIPKDIILSRASTYRNSGVKLKKMRRRHGRPIDVEALNRLIMRISREGDGHDRPKKKG